MSAWTPLSAYELLRLRTGNGGHSPTFGQDVAPTRSDAKKIGPGLKGLGKRGTFTVNNNKVTDESLRVWIENGDNLMPPFKDVLDPAQIKDVVAYVKSL